MVQQYLLDPIPCDKFSILSREELEIFAKEEQRIRIVLQKEITELKKQRDQAEQKSLLIQGDYVIIKKKIFGKSSEKSPNSESESKEKLPPRTKVQLPSARYPNAPIIETDIELEVLPNCTCCGTQMQDSGMTEDSEFLTVIPRQFFIVKQKKHKYRCGGCHGDIKTAPGLPKIKAGSSYSDEMVIDVAMSKYCDLIPIERYVAMASRSGIMGLPPHSLIQTTHALSDFVIGAYEKLKDEVTSELVLHADETPHRMLEGDQKSNWYLWGFSTTKASYFEIHDTRSGDVASNLLKGSKCEHLVSDVFSGYAKAVRETNVFRAQMGLPLIQNVYCNSHSRRKFKDAMEIFGEEAEFYIEEYKEIYKLEADLKLLPKEERQSYRDMMRPHYARMKEKALSEENAYPSKSLMGKAISYFLKNYDALILFLNNIDLPIDNNSQERLMRNPVIGRKTWYGTHSKRGAKTAAVLFSLVESCRLNKVNPRKYFEALVESLHQGKATFTPAEWEETA
jgi:transposase